MSDKQTNCMKCVKHGPDSRGDDVSPSICTRCKADIIDVLVKCRDSRPDLRIDATEIIANFLQYARTPSAQKQLLTISLYDLFFNCYISRVFPMFVQEALRTTAVLITNPGFESVMNDRLKYVVNGGFTAPPSLGNLIGYPGLMGPPVNRSSILSKATHLIKTVLEDDDCVQELNFKQKPFDLHLRAAVETYEINITIFQPNDQGSESEFVSEIRRRITNLPDVDSIDKSPDEQPVSMDAQPQWGAYDYQVYLCTCKFVTDLLIDRYGSIEHLPEISIDTVVMFALNVATKSLEKLHMFVKCLIINMCDANSLTITPSVIDKTWQDFHQLSV